MNKSLHAALLVCVLGLGPVSADAEDTKFGDWTVSVNPGPSSASPAARTPRSAGPAENAIQQLRRVRAVCSSLPHHYGLKPIGSDVSLYFPWRNQRALRAFSSRYSPRTIYSYGR